LVTKLKNIKYSIFAKIVAIILAWLCLINIWIIVVDLSDEENLRIDSYYASSSFMREYSKVIYETIELYIELDSEENADTGIVEKLDRYNYLKNKLSLYINYVYYIKDINTGEVVATNIKTEDPVKLIRKQKSMVHCIGGEELEGMYWSTFGAMERLKGTNYEMYTAVIEPMKEGDVFYENYVRFKKSKEHINFTVAVFILLVIVTVTAISYLIYAAGNKKGIEGIVLKWWDRYFDIHTLIVSIIAIQSLLHMVDNFYDIFIEEFIILSLDFFIGLTYLLSLVRQLKAKSIKKNLFIYKAYYKLLAFARLLFEGKIFRPWVIVLLGAYCGVNSIILTLLYLAIIHNDGKVTLFTLIPFIVFNGIALYIATKSLRDLPQIMEAAKQMAGGNLDYKLDIENMSVTFSSFAENIQSIQMGLKKAVEDAIKGERMKTDLITNVSHDLKTPLTSIINYVDLLKKESIENKKAKEYIEVLDEKSARLKVLIEDLIEASKASSGNLPVNIEKLDMCELVMQAIGEYREKFEGRGLDVRLKYTEKNIFVQADGKHMWRIIENLLSNILKYSMKNSRVYINLARNEAYGILTFKNISELPLEIPVDQLTERFVRGDISRTTEGSGLGLSIAQSLTNIQKGNFHIEIDGDLFKATVEIPLWS